MANIVLCGGGSAGHTMPHIALLPRFRAHFSEIHYIGSQNGIERDIISNYPEIIYHPIECAKLKRSLDLGNLLIPFKLTKGVLQSRAILKEVKPAVIFSKGGYVSLPVVMASGKIPVVLHESDLTMGLANKMAAPFAKVICTSFEPTTKRSKKAVYTGTPLRAELFFGDASKIKSQFRLNDQKPVITVMGGSLGARAINAALRQALGTLTIKYQIIHIVGKGNINPSLNYPGYHQIEFSKNIADIFAASEMVISRAGSNTIFELLALKKPMLLIPLPKGASRGDQIQNAEYFKSKGLAYTLDQNNLTSASLVSAVTETYNNRGNLKKVMTEHPGVDGTAKLAEIILKYSRNH